jgi:hypothetical protein
MTDIELPPQYQRRAHTEPKPRAVKKFVITDFRLSPPKQRAHTEPKPQRNFVMTDIELPPQYQRRAHTEPKPRAVKKFVMTDFRLSPPKQRAHTEPKPQRNFVMTDIELPQQPPTSRQRRNFVMTDIELPPPLPRTRRIRKSVVKTYKLNKHLSYNRGLHILKKISE